jgi:S1-C subfamily serine protease
MKYFAILGSAVTLCSLFASQPVWADGFSLPSGLTQFLLHSSQGYLGVYLGDAKVPHAAEIINVDHDAPASKSGLKAHDVILQLDGRPFDNLEQLRRRLHDMPAGRTISLLISHEDGSRQTVTVTLCNRKRLEQQAWSNHHSVKPPTNGSLSFMGTGGFHGPAFLDSMIPSGPDMGADVKPVRTQLADYFGVTRGTGLLVENVDSPSAAEEAGLKAGDVVTKVDSQSMATRSDWVKAMRTHHGKQMQITVMRNRQEQVLTMAEGKPKKN